MIFYKVYLSLNIASDFSYKSEEIIEKGSRVLVSFSNKMYTGICGESSKSINYNENKIKFILDVLDTKPTISEEQYKFAKWIAKYYLVPLGIVFNAMLPAALNMALSQSLKKLKDADETNSAHEKEILSLANKYNAIDIETIKDYVKIPRFYFVLEQLETKEFIEIQRVFDEKIKTKIANFVKVIDHDYNGKLTQKQSEFYKLILSFDEDVKLSAIAKQFSYSIVKSFRKKKIIELVPREVKDEQIYFKRNSNTTKKEIILTVEQKTATERIISSVDKNIFEAFLLYGITGSGKTEVYINVVNRVISQGKNALILVPEISLAPQMVERFFSDFNDQIAVLHSHLNDRERWEEWKRIKNKKARIVIGARSAIFAPLKNIGVIIVDEEHETTYKQDTMPRYNARDLAVVRAKMNNVVFIGGTATPSLESWSNALKGNYTLLKLKHRPNLKKKLPKVKIIDLTEVTIDGEFSSELINGISQRLENKEQIVLLHNRRGFSSFMQCLSCGKLFKCPDCDISLNYHKKNEQLMCHYCGYKTDVPRKCDDCGNFIFRFGAPGIEQIETQLKLLFPSARILRMDSDTTNSKNSYFNMYDQMRSNSVDILLGTQMIAKGLDFPNVTLVGVISADIGLNMPDFRAAEKTFQILTQVAGRAGRGSKEGEVIIQTYNAEHYSILTARDQNFDKFAEAELELRQELYYAPFTRMARILFEYPFNDFLVNQIQKNKRIIDQISAKLIEEGIIILGPSSAPFVRLRNKYRYHIIIKSKTIAGVAKSINVILQNIKLSKKIKITTDIDPSNLF